MFVHLAVHHPRAGKEAALIGSMRRFDGAAEGAPGHLQHLILRDDQAGVLVGVTMWDSRWSWEATVPLMRAAVQDDPFDEWWERHPDVFGLEEA